MENQNQEMQLTLEQQLQQAREQLDQVRKERIIYCEEKQIDEAIEILIGFDNLSIPEDVYARSIDLVLPDNRILRVGGQFSPYARKASFVGASWRNVDELEFVDENLVYWRGDEEGITIFRPGSWWLDILLEQADKEKKVQEERRMKAELDELLQEMQNWKSLD